MMRIEPNNIIKITVMMCREHNRRGGGGEGTNKLLCTRYQSHNRRAMGQDFNAVSKYVYMYINICSRRIRTYK